MQSIEEMVSKGQAKMAAKAGTMKANYDAARGRMVEGYNLTPFNARMKAAYSSGVARGAQFYHVDAEKWARNFRSKVA